MRFTLYSVQHAMCNVYFAVYSVQYAVCSMQYVVCSMQSKVSNMQCVGCSEHCAVYSVHHALFSVQCLVCSVQCAMCSRGGHDHFFFKRDGTRNGPRNIIFQQQKNKNNRQKTGGKTQKKLGGKTGGKQGEKPEKYKKCRNKTRQDFGKARFLQDKILENANNGNENKNKVFTNVTKQRFESKQAVSVQA